MSKSLQKGIIFAVCIALVCALGVTLFIFDGTGGAVTGQEGQASAVAQNMATYTHGSNIRRPLPSDYTSVSDGTALKAAIEANNKDIVLTNDVTLQTINAFEANKYLWNDNSQCFDSDGNGNTDLKVTGFTHKIYGQGYTIEVQGPHAATGQGMQQNSAETNDYGGLFPKLGNNGAVYDAKIYITKGFSGQTQKTYSGWTSSNDEWLNVGGIAGSLIGNAVIDNVTVEIASGVKLASYKWSDGSRTSQYVRVGAIAGEINNTASISNVTVINNGRLESGQYTSEAKFSPDSERYYGAAGNVVGWISSATSSINNVRVEGSGTLYSYYVANIANATGSTVSVNNFYNNFTGTFDAKYKYSNTLGQGEGATSTLTVTNHYKKGALASTAGTDNTVVATNTLTVPNNLTLYFIPNATQDSDRLGIDFSGTTYSSANDYTVTGLNNAEKTASGGFSAAPSGGTLALGLPVGANNWKTDGTFASITATSKFDPSSYAALTKYEHGYVSSRTTNSGTPITSDNFSTYFAPGGQANNSSDTYYLTNDIVVTGFTGINFSGTFDGNGHTIFITANNTTSGSAVGGLVGNMTGGTIKNVRVVILSDLTIGTVNDRGGSVGGLVGAMSGGARLENVQVVIESEAAIKTNMASDTDHSLGGVVGRISGVSSLTNVTLELKGTLAAVGSYTFTGGIAGNIDTIGTADTITFKNIIVRGNGTFKSSAENNEEPPYYAALGILERNSGTNAKVTIDGLIYDANPTLTGTYNGGTDYAMYGIFSNNNWSKGSTSNNVNYHQYVTYSNIFFTENAGTISDDINTAKHNGGNAIIPIGDDTTVKTINNAVTGVDGSAVKAYFMPGDSASENLTLVASASNWNGVTQLQLDGAAPAVTSADDGSNKVVNVAKSTAVNISGENLTLSPYNPYTVITASLVTDTKVYDGNPFAAQVSFDLDGGDLSLTEGQYTITYTDGNATGETNANVGDGTYSLTVTLKGTASDGTQYVFDAQGTKTKTFTYTITPLEVTGTWSVRGLEITYGDSAPDYDQYISIELTNEGTIPGGLTESNIAAQDFSSDYVKGTTQAGNTVTITAGTFTVGSGFTASNYNFSGITGSGSLEVQKREITISAADIEDPAVGHIVAIYGGTNYVTSQADLQNLLTWANVSDYVENVYGTDEIGFTITAVAHEQTGDGATYAPGEAVQDGEWAKLPAKDTYYITVTSANNNYTVAENNYFKYQVSPAELVVTGVVWDDTALDTITYDGQKHTAKLKVTGLVGEDTYDSALIVSLTLNSEAVENGVNAGTYTVDVYVNEDDKYYDLSVSGDSADLTLAISPITLTISDKSGVYTDFVAADIVIEDMVNGILEGDSAGVTIDVVWDTTPADENGYLAAGTYNATLRLSGDKSANYTFGSDNIATVAVDQFDLTKAHITITSEQFTYDRTEKTVEYTVLTAEGGKDITALLTAEGDKQTNANAKYTVTLSGDDNFTGTAAADWSIDQKTLTVSPYEADFLDYDLSSLYAYLTSADSGLITGAVEGDTLTFLGTAWETETSAPPTNVEIGSKEYVKAGSYTLNMVLSGDSYTNYKFEDNAMSVTINALDISGAVVTWNEDLTYNAEEQSVSLASVTVSGVVMPVDWFTPQNNTGTDADTYTATVEASNANITGSVSKDFTIAPVAVTVKWEAAGEISVGTAMPADATDMSALDLTARVTEFNAPGITETAQYSIVVTASGFGAGHIFTMGEQVTLIPSMTFGQGAKEANYHVTFDPATITKAATAISVEVSPVNATPDAVIYGNSVKNADEFISAVYFTIKSGAEGSALTPDNFTVTVTDENGEAVFDSMHGLDAGTYTVTIEGKGAYSVINDANSFTYKVDPLTLTQGTWSGVDGLTYNGKAAAPEFKPEGVLEGDSVTATITVTGEVTDGQAINAGSYTVTAEITGGEDMGNYVLDESSASTSFTIAQMVLQGEWKVASDMNMTYDGTSKAGYATWTWTTAPLKEGDVTANITFTKDGEQADPIAAGDYTAIVTLTDNTGNYDTTEITSTVDFTIEQRVVVLNWEAVGDDDLVYDGAPHELTATVSNKVVGDEVEVSVELAADNNNVNVTEQGFVYVAIGLTGNDAGNYKLPENKQSEAFKVTPAQKEITWNFVEHPTIVYGDSVEDVKALVNTAALNGTIPGVTGTLTFTVSVGNYSASTNAGTEVTFDVSYTLPEGAKANNYEITVKAAEGNTLTVGKAKVNLTTAESASLTKVYDGKAVTLDSLLTAGNVSVKGMKNGENAFDLKILRISGKAGMTDMTNAALYDGIVIEIIKDCNYISEPLKIEYTITPKPIGVDWTDTAFEYDGTAHKPTATATELVGEDTLTLTVTGEQTNANAEGEPYTATVKAFEQGNYKLEKDATVEFTISRKTVSVKWDDTEFTYNGSAQKPTATVGEAQGLVTGDDLQITVSGEQTDVNTSGGSYTAIAEITGGEDMGNYVLDKSSVSKNFTIAPKPITITFTSDEGEAINFDVAGRVTVGEWTIDSGNAKATLVLSDGTTEITLTVEASDEALPTVENVPALWLLLDSKFYEGTPYGTEVKGGSLTVVSADKNYVFEGAQTITINITPAISVGLKDGVQEKLGLTDVLKTAHNADYFKNNYLKVTGKDGAEVTGGTLEVTITPSEGLELLEGVIKHAGTYTVKAVYTPEGAGDGAEKPTFSFEFTVTPVEVTSVIYSGEPLVYGDLSASGGIAVTVEYADGKKAENVTAQYTSEHVSTGNWLKAGNTQVTVSYTGDNRDYAAVTEHVITLTVAQKTITATINYGEQSGTALTLTYKGSEYTIGAELNNVLSGDGVSAEVLDSFTDVAASPEVVITLAGADSDNYKVEGEYTVTITPADVTYEWSFDGAITYGDSVEDVTALAVMPDGALLGVEEKVTFQVSVNYSATTNAGTEVTFDVSYTLPEDAKEENYNIIITAANGNTLTVGKATLNLSIADAKSLTKVYDGEAVTLGSLLTAGNVSVEGMKNGEDAFKPGILVINGTTQEITNVGEMSGSVTVKDDSNYTATPLEITYKITPKPIDVAWSNTEFTYDGTAHKPTATATGLVGGDSLTLTVTGAQTNANAEGETYTATVKAFEQGNYKLESDSTQTFTIKKAAAALAIKDYDAIQASVYKGSAFVVTPLLNGAEDTQGIVEVEFFDKTNSSATVAVQEIKNAGVYTVTLTVNNANYEYAQSSFTVTVSPKSIGVKWTNTEFTYDGTAHKPTATAEGLVGGDSLTLTVTGAQMNAGSYTATVKAASVTGNYKLESDSTQAFTIKKADLTVTPASLEIRERETEVMQAFAEGEDLAEAFAGRISVSGVSGTVGYTVTIAGDNNYDDDGLLTVGAHTFTIDAGDNYNAASVSVTVIATPVVTVIASVEGELVYNGSAFEISYALKEGAPEDVSMDDITVTASVETIVNAGEYKVTFTVTGSNEDYDYVVQDASGNAALTFTVAQRGLDVAEVAEAVYGNLQVSGTLVTGTHTAFVAYNDEEIELIVNVKTAALSRAAAEYLDAGEYEVTIALANENGNFSLNGATLNAETEKMEVPSTLDVAPKTVTVGYTPSSKVYDAKGISLTLDEFEDMLIEGDDPAVNIYINDALYTGRVVLDAGTYTVRYESADPNYAFEPVSATFTVESKRVTPSFDLNTGTGSQQITGGGKLEIEEGEETDIIAAIDNFMQSSGVPEEDMSISVSGDLKLEEMATWAPGTYTVTVALSGNHSGFIEFTVEVSEKIELPPPVQPELPETPAEAGSGNDWVLPLIIAIVALIDLALLVAIGVAAKKRA